MKKSAKVTRPPRSPSARPTAYQVRCAEAVLAWHGRVYQGRSKNLGTLDTFTDSRQVGAFAVQRGALRRGDGDSLFRLLVAVSMFQRRQDQQVLRILRGMTIQEVIDLTCAKRLLKLAAESPCDALRGTEALSERCDLTKSARTRLGICAYRPGVACHLKRHTVLMKRYGHFGKVPTSAALSLRDQGVTSIGELRKVIWRRETDPHQRAEAIDAALQHSWRVSEKIAAMYLSALCAPGLTAHPPIWTGVDWTHFIVIDSNTDLFLGAVGYMGAKTYQARRAFLRLLAAEVAAPGRRGKRRGVNVRVMQQSMYAFMSVANRRATPTDCMHHSGACLSCPRVVRLLCPVVEQTSGGQRTACLRRLKQGATAADTRQNANP
jgi:hypothetical protein